MREPTLVLGALLAGCSGRDPIAARVEAPAVGLRDLTCTVHGPARSESFRWLRDGVGTDERAAVLPVDRVHPGESWSCRVKVGVGGHSVTATSDPYVVPTPVGGNVLLVVLDDVGIDRIGAYAASPEPARTPRIDALAAEGVRFQTVYASPSCSVSRAQLLTGRYGLRTGFVETITGHSETFQLPRNEITIPEMLHDAPGKRWTSGAFGKWHLVDADLWTTHSVTDQGFDEWMGTIDEPAPNYFSWQQWNRFGAVPRLEYATSAVIDDALGFLDQAKEPWFVYLPMHAAHAPLNLPPADLVEELPGDDKGPADLVDAMIEAADTEIGRLLDSIPADVLSRTTIVLTADNGTAYFAVRPPLDPNRAKLTVYEAGVRVPLIVTGYGVQGPPRVSEDLVDWVDLFPTIADLAGVPLTGNEPLNLVRDPPVPIDGVSLLPLLRDPDATLDREFLYAAKSHPNGPPPWSDVDATVRDRDWKYVDLPSGPELYHLNGDDLDDGPDVLGFATPSQEALDEMDRLAAELERIRSETPYAWGKHAGDGGPPIAR